MISTQDPFAIASSVLEKPIHQQHYTLEVLLDTR